MSDALKPVLVSPTALAAIGASANVAAVASATAATLPPTLATIASGNVLAGIVIERGRGSVLLKTDKGQIQLATNLPLRLGASVVLEVQSLGAQVRFAVVSVDQRAPQLLTPDVTAELPGEAPLASSRGDGRAVAASAESTRATLIGRVVTAELVAPPMPRASMEGDAIPMLLKRVAALAASLGTPPAAPNAGAATVPAPLPQLPAAETLETILAAIESLPPEVAEALLGVERKPAATPQAPGPASAIPARAATPPAETPTTAAPSAASAPESAHVIATAAAASPKALAIRLVEVQPPTPAGARTTPIRPNAAGDSITLVGTVSAVADRIELETPIGTLRLPIAAVLPPGSRIAFEVVLRAETEPAAPPAASAAAAPQRTLAADPPRESWTALRDVVAALPPESDIGAIPKPGPLLGPSLLAFIAAVRGGSARALLGSATVDSLESSTRTRLLDRLGDELAAEARAAAVPDRNGWQTMAVPLLDGDRLGEIRVHIQKRRGGDKDRDDGGSRFIVEATLSALGPMQLDGLVRAQRFDLIVRTERPLPEAMRRDIETLFARALSDTAYSGGVSFRGDMEMRVPTRGPAARGSGVVV